MTNITKKFATAIATGALFAQAVAPVAFAETTLEISGNGAGSDNNVTANQTSNTSVNQTNNANITNKVNAEANTGKNDANYNTGGNVTVKTGDATVNAHVSNNVNSNVAEVENCNCAQDTHVKVSGNGAFSDNDVEVTNKNNVDLNQKNNADIYNKVNVDGNTGKNSAGFNTGGDVVVMTGDANTSAHVSTAANANWARIGSGGHGNGDVSLMILDNGAGSDNYISAYIKNETDLYQKNDADVTNKVDVDADTGRNDANFNTGDGWVIIDTGKATVDASIDNEVNFNAADVDCGCVYDLLAKIAGNGANVGHNYDSDSDNKIRATLAHEQELDQLNFADLYNDLDAYDVSTGENEASKNTAGSDTDPAIFTGDASVTTSVENAGNSNILGDLGMPEVELPEVDLDWNWSAMWAFFGMSMHS